jgi:hypothetical protein
VSNGGHIRSPAVLDRLKMLMVLELVNVGICGSNWACCSLEQAVAFGLRRQRQLPG